MSDPESIQADIKRSRADLAATVDDLSARLGQRKQEAKGIAVKVGAVAGAVVAVLVVVRIVKAKRS